MSARNYVLATSHGYYGLTAVFADVNNDGKPDLLVANDSKPNYLYLNKGNGTFEDASYASGYAFNENGRETASMGIALGDYRTMACWMFTTLFFPTITIRFTETKATAILPMSVTSSALRKSRFRFWAGATGFSITTMTAGKIFLW